MLDGPSRKTVNKRERKEERQRRERYCGHQCLIICIVWDQHFWSRLRKYVFFNNYYSILLQIPTKQITLIKRSMSILIQL